MITEGFQGFLEAPQTISNSAMTTSVWSSAVRILPEKKHDGVQSADLHAHSKQANSASLSALMR